MKERKIIIIGGTAAGPSAAAKAKRINPSAEVLIYESSGTISYGICEAPYAISGLIDNESKLVKYTPDKLQLEKGVKVRINHQVEKIIPAKHKIIVRDFTSHEVFEDEYDKLIIATGSYPKKMNVPGEDGRNIFHLKNREDTKNILNYLSSENPKSAVIIGAGYIGMEMAEALRSRLPEVTILDISNLPMDGFEEETRKRVLTELNNNDVQFIPNVNVEAFQQDDSGKIQHVITNRGAFQSDIVIISLGVMPNTDLAEEAGIRIGNAGGILTDQRMQTNIDNIYAAGDCCEVKNIVTGKAAYYPLASVASRTAWVAGENAAGGRAVFAGAIGSAAVKIFNLQVATVGISSQDAIQNRFKIVTEVIQAPNRNELMPGSESVTIKLIVDKANKRLIGANLFSCCGAVLRADVLAVAIQQKMTIDDIAQLDLIYSPPFAPLWDPVLIAANQIKKKLS